MGAAQTLLPVKHPDAVLRSASGGSTPDAKHTGKLVQRYDDKYDDIAEVHVSRLLPFFLLNCTGCATIALREKPRDVYRREGATVFTSDESDRVYLATLAARVTTFSELAALALDNTSYEGFCWWGSMLLSLQNLYANPVPDGAAIHQKNWPRDFLIPYTIATLHLPDYVEDTMHVIDFTTYNAIQVLGAVDTDDEKEHELLFPKLNGFYLQGDDDQARLYLWLLQDFARTHASQFLVSLHSAWDRRADTRDTTHLHSYPEDERKAARFDRKPVIVPVRQFDHWYLHIFVPGKSGWRIFEADSLNASGVSPRAPVTYPLWVTNKRPLNKNEPIVRIPCFQQKNNSDCLFLSLFMAAHLVCAGASAHPTVDATTLSTLVFIGGQTHKALEKRTYTSTDWPLCTIDAGGRLRRSFSTQRCRKHIMTSLETGKIDLDSLVEDVLLGLQVGS